MLDDNINVVSFADDDEHEILIGELSGEKIEHVEMYFLGIVQIVGDAGCLLPFCPERLKRGFNKIWLDIRIFRYLFFEHAHHEGLFLGDQHYLFILHFVFPLYDRSISVFS